MLEGGETTLLKRASDPDEMAEAYLFVMKYVISHIIEFTASGLLDADILRVSALKWTAATRLLEISKMKLNHRSRM